MYGVVLEDDARVDPAALTAALDGAGIETRPFFWPMHEQPVFASDRTMAGGNHPVASKLGRRGLYLPSGPTLAPEDLARVVTEVRRVLG